MRIPNDKRKKTKDTKDKLFSQIKWNCYMIISKGSGRLGNQLFQYAALRTLCEQNEKLVLLLGFDDLQKAFDGINAKY